MRRIRIPKKEWTPFRNQIFTEELGDLKEKHAAQLYFYLYDKAYHTPSGTIGATRAQLSRWTNFDVRVVTKCLSELQSRGLIELVRGGVLHSRMRKDCWEVPLATFILKDEKWTPIPRVLIREYLPAYPNSVLLPVLLSYQHLNWINHSWVGVAKLSKRLGWSATRVRESLRTMSDKET
jgi:hypothetical protein